MTEAVRRPQHLTTGIATIVASVLAMSIADTIIKSSSAHFTLWQVYVLRSLLVIPTLIAMMRLRRSPIDLRAVLKPWVILRSLLLAFMYVALYAAIPVLSLPVIAASAYTGPLFIALLSALLIGEPVGGRRWLAIAIGFGGVLLVIRPAAADFSPLALIPVGSALLYALAAIITRSKCAAEAPPVLGLALNLGLLILGGAMSALLASWQPSLPDGAAYPFLLGPWGTTGLREWGILAVLAVLMLGISIGLAKAYQSAPPSIIATFDYSYLLFAGLWSYLVFAEAPNLPTMAGMALIALAGWLVVGRPSPTVRQVATTKALP
ncbi:DMT family transporter [Hypericibacter adhaerens]|nr:DMT family transporter [Hypericibacter adhaerens]